MYEHIGDLLRDTMNVTIFGIPFVIIMLLFICTIIITRNKGKMIIVALVILLSLAPFDLRIRYYSVMVVMLVISALINIIFFEDNSLFGLVQREKSRRIGKMKESLAYQSLMSRLPGKQSNQLGTMLYNNTQGSLNDVIEAGKRFSRRGR